MLGSPVHSSQTPTTPVVNVQWVRGKGQKKLDPKLWGRGCGKFFSTSTGDHKKPWGMGISDSSYICKQPTWISSFLLIPSWGYQILKATYCIFWLLLQEHSFLTVLSFHNLRQFGFLVPSFRIPVQNFVSLIARNLQIPSLNSWPISAIWSCANIYSI